MERDKKTNTIGRIRRITFVREKERKNKENKICEGEGKEE
jgi:hypothetical protein